MNTAPPSESLPSGIESGAGRPAVAFDFDGTLTVRDSYTAFLRWRMGGLDYALAGLALAPALAAYLGLRDRGRLKEAATREHLRGVQGERLRAEAERFAAERFDALMRPDALAAWGRWAGGNVRRVIVTASPEPVVAPFAARLGADALIGTRLEVDRDDHVTGRFVGPNCRGAEKVARLREAFGPDLRLLAAYGDTTGDREMLAAAEQPYFRVFTARPPPA